VIFVPEWPNGEFVSILVSFYVWTKSLMCKDVVNKDSTIQSDVRRFCLQVKRIQVPCQPSGRSSHPVHTPICKPFQPSGRRAIPSGPYTVSRSFCTSLHTSRRLSSPSGRPSVIYQLQILSKFRIREDRYIRPDDVGVPSGRASP
jgi:hypothetical protein